MNQSFDFCISLEECYQTIIQTMAEGVFVVNREGFIIFANQAMAQITGYPIESLIGTRCHTIIKHDCSKSKSCSLKSGKDMLHRDCEITRRDGSIIPVLRNAKLKRDESGHIKGIIETVTDISELKNAKNQIAEMELKNATSNKYRSMIGKSQVIQDVFNLIQLAADSSASILVTGESGTGKEMIAELIHNQSARKNEAIVKINCSALSENLLESELFGHVKGAFTGAIKDKKGRFEIANGGTLFLDEISDISPLIQLKILRFLQEREFERVGDHVTRISDVRIISATNKDLTDLIKQGRFREDLFYRLKVFPIRLPALRERKEDIPLLVDHFITKFNTETSKQINGFSRRAIAALLDYYWPGNVRELENAIEHAFVIRRSGEIRLSDLPPEIIQTDSIQVQHHPDKAGETPSQQEREKENTSGKSSISEEELLAALAQCNWNKSKTAKNLNINRTTVWRLMKKYNIG